MSDGRCILVVEDDAEIGALLVELLRRAGFDVVLHADGAAALAEFDWIAPDLVLLDVMLPGEDGFAVLDRLRARGSECPVIMLTALGGTEAQVRGLRGGADDYVAKPFAASELLARIDAVLRRTRPGAPVRRFDGWTLDMRARRLVAPDGREVGLTGSELDLLAALSLRAGSPLSRDEIAEIIQDRKVEPYDRSIDTMISRLRQKLGAAGAPRNMIATLRNRGYVFTPKIERPE